MFSAKEANSRETSNDLSKFDSITGKTIGAIFDAVQIIITLTETANPSAAFETIEFSIFSLKAY